MRCLAARHNLYFVGFATAPDAVAERELAQFCMDVKIFLQPAAGRWNWRFYLALGMNLFSPLPFSVKKYFRKDVAKYISHVVEKNKIDLVHVDMLHLGIYHPYFKNFPNLLVNHNVESLALLRTAKIFRNPLAKAYLFLQYQKLQVFEKKTLPLFDVNVVVSGHDQAVLQRRVPSGRYEIIPNGVDVDYFVPGEKTTKAKEIIWVGGMKDMDNRDAVDYSLKRIWPFIIEQVPDVKITFVGKAPTKRLRKAAGRSANVSFTGYVADVRPFVDKALVFIAPLRSGGGTKLKVLNAMAMAKAVVTTTIGAEGIHAKNEEHFFVADDCKMFADHVIHLLSNPGRAVEVGKKARQFVEEHYDWRTIGELMERICQRVYASTVNMQTLV